MTSRCNSRCPFCFYWKRLNEKQDELTIEEIEMVSGSLGRLFWVLFSGGEIFLREDIDRISRIFYDNNKPVFLTLPTNGLLPSVIEEKTEKVLKHCKNSVVVVKLSLDGLGEEHDRLRGVKGNYDKVMETYERLSGFLDEYPNFELGINTLFSAANQDKIYEIITFVNSLDNIKTHTVSLVRGNLENEDFKKIDLSLYCKVIETMEHNLKENVASTYRFSLARFKAAQDILQRRMIYKTLEMQKRLIPCYAGRLNIVMNEVGDIYPCEILDTKMGNVRDYDYDVKGLLESRDTEDVRKKISSNGCYCSHECYLATNILFNPRMYAELFREYLQML